MASTDSITVIQGNSVRIEVQVKNGNALVDLTNAQSVDWIVLYSVTTPGTQLIHKSLTNGILITDPPNGRFAFIVNPVDTRLMVARDYYHEARCVTADGTVLTPFLGTLTLQGSGLK